VTRFHPAQEGRHGRPLRVPSDLLIHSLACSANDAIDHSGPPANQRRPNHLPACREEITTCLSSDLRGAAEVRAEPDCLKWMRRSGREGLAL
jgi:hypothetical protein